MTRERYSAQRDLTATLNYAVPTGPHHIMYQCREPNHGPHHKGLRKGGLWSGRVPVLCPVCNAKRGAQ